MHTEKAITYRIETDRLIIRCYRLEDAPMVSEAILKSLDHLRPWMPWARTHPEDPGSTLNLVKIFRDKFHADEDYFFGIFNKAENELLGSTGLHTRIGNAAREIGYWINVAHVQQGYATEAVSALIKIGFTVENLKRIEIHCDPRNTISQKIPKALGFSNIATLSNNNTDEDGKPRDTMIWSLLRTEYNKTALTTYKVKAFGKGGQEIRLSPY
ncbi:MAG TPA: GNAT family protein [Puia sp.]|nr:GNAT family protein [Puia sp.]